MDKVRVVVWGLGAMGSGMVRLLLQKPGVEVVGAVARRPERHGDDLGHVVGDGQRLGVRVSGDATEMLARARPDVVLHATTSFMEEAFGELVTAIRCGANVITIAEEMAYPWVTEPERAREADSLAKRYGVSVLGTGINPGFVLDSLILMLTGVCARVDRIRGVRVNDLSPYGPTVMRTQGVGRTPEEFERGLREGTIVGHVGFRQSMGMIAAALGWRLDQVRELREPIISTTRRAAAHAVVEPGMVAGCRHTAHGLRGDRCVITLEHPQQIRPEVEGIETGDYISIEGEPPVNLAIKPEIPGGIGTVALAVNMVPAVLEANPGLKTMTDLPLPRALPQDVVSLMTGGGRSVERESAPRGVGSDTRGGAAGG